MSHPVWYTRRMIIKTDMKKDTTFEVTVNGRTEFVNAQDQDHANRIAVQMELRENHILPADLLTSLERWAADQS